MNIDYLYGSSLILFISRLLCNTRVSFLLILAPGLMISAFAKAGAAFLKDAIVDAEEAEKKSACYVQRAIKAAAFLRQHLFDPASGRLIRSCYRSSALDDASRAERGDTNVSQK